MAADDWRAISRQVLQQMATRTGLPISYSCTSVVANDESVVREVENWRGWEMTREQFDWLQPGDLVLYSTDGEHDIGEVLWIEDEVIYIGWARRWTTWPQSRPSRDADIDADYRRIE
jgi:hypothetical protein